MFKKHFLYLLMAFSSGFVYANNSDGLPIQGRNLDEMASPCNLPAPDSAYFTEAGPNWLIVKWDDPTPGVQHRIITRTVIGNTIVSNLVAPAGVSSIKINGLQPGIFYLSTVNAICPDGTDSPNIATTFPPWAIIVSELIVSGIIESTFPANCTVNESNESCNFPLKSLNNFKIRPANDESSGRQFEVSNTGNIMLTKVTSNEGDYLMRIDNQIPDQFGKFGSTFQIYYGNNPIPIAEFQLSYVIQGGVKIGRLTRKTINPDYEIVRLSPCPGCRPDSPSSGQIRPRDSQTTTPLLSTVSPNPFSESLDIYLEQPSTENIHLQLFNLSGQKVLDQQFAGGQEQYSLSTANLVTGFYLLRIEADGNVQTLKVIKSE